MGKRLDATGLIYFGQRYYDPNLSRWLTPDPAGPLDSSNLYQYVFNNPLAYLDPDGQFVFAIPLLVWGAELVMPTLTAIAMPLIYTAVTGAVAYAGYELVQKWNQAPGDVWSRLPTFANQTHNPYIITRNKVYASDRPLPKDKDGIPIPDTDAPHTQLGIRKKQYPQAREFDKDGNPVRDIDFTDHNSPEIHPNPHQHPYKNNPNGGTPQRGPAQPL